MTNDLRERIAKTLVQYAGPEHAELRALIVDLSDEQARYDRLMDEHNARLAELERMVAGLQRAGKRQAAPFSPGLPKANPKKAGRKAGPDYGPKAHRAVPARAPDRQIHAALPTCCPDCGGEIDESGESTQVIEDIQITTVITEVIVATGHCRDCHRRVQGRHPEQVSDAVGAASSQVGPFAQALIAILGKDCGASHGKIARVLRVLGISITTGGVSSILARLATKADPTYEAIKVVVNASPTVAPDETGWKVGGWPAWLWVFATASATAYSVDHKRSYDAATKVLSADYAGVITRDGWAPYRKFAHATHQTCLAHLLRRATGLIETKARGYSTVPTILKEILTDALALRDARDDGEIALADLEVAVVDLEARFEALLARRGHTEQNRRLLKHLRNESGALFSFLRHDGVDATNYRAEQGVRPAVVNRKVWGGNRTDAGARTHERLMSLLRTAAQQKADALEILVELIRSPVPMVAALNLAPRAP
jgi:transposase